MTKDEALKLALEALESERDKYLEWGDEDGAPDDVYEAITAIKQARSAPVQEPRKISDFPELQSVVRKGLADGSLIIQGAAPVQEPVAWWIPKHKAPEDWDAAAVAILTHAIEIITKKKVQTCYMKNSSS